MVYYLQHTLTQWESRGTLLPYPDFQKSARTMEQIALRTCRRTLSTIHEIQQEFEQDWANVNFPYPGQLKWSKYWWSLWQPYPLELLMYEHEILTALVFSTRRTRRRYEGDGITADLATCKKRLVDLGHSDFSAAAFGAPSVTRRLMEKISWLGDERLHACHRNYLLHSKRTWYRQYGWRDPNIKKRSINEKEEDNRRYHIWFPNENYYWCDKELKRYASIKEKELV